MLRLLTVLKRLFRFPIRQLLLFELEINAPTISIFGVTDQRRKAPISTKNVKHVYVWKKPVVKGWNDDGVFRDFDKIKTIEEITVEQVFDKITKLLNK